MIAVQHLDRSQRAHAQQVVTDHHYLHSPVLGRACPEGWGVRMRTAPGAIGYLLVARPQATACYPWYGSVADVERGRAEVTRWQVLNLARVWLEPVAQQGGVLHERRRVPGYVDRRGVWRSTLASEALRALVQVVGFEYLLARPPVFLEEPYEVRYLLSYCDSSQHRGVIYQAAGFQLYRTNGAGLQTWRIELPRLTPDQHAAIAAASEADPRARRFRAERTRERAQLHLAIGRVA